MSEYIVRPAKVKNLRQTKKETEGEKRNIKRKGKPSTTIEMKIPMDEHTTINTYIEAKAQSSGSRSYIEPPRGKKKKIRHTHTHTTPSPCNNTL